ncbi:MAG: carbohydrate porin [Candidatus Omnitrophica bacterium]|nr:carbohydrate porin [Candidatus Omnitrophota bacterium]
MAYAKQTILDLSQQLDQTTENGVNLEDWLDRFLKERKILEDKYGTSFAFIINAQVQSLLYARANQGKSRSAWYYNIGIEQKLWSDAYIVFELEGGHNKGIDKLLPTLSGLNSDAGEISYAYVNRFYLHQDFLDKKIFFNLGRLDLSDWFDSNEAANSGDIQFLSGALVGNLTVPFPQKGLGGVVGFSPVDWFYFQVGAADALASSTKAGFNRSFKGSFFIGEFGFLPKMGVNLQGNYRFMFYLDRQNLEYIDGLGKRRRDCGYALSFDQQVTKRITFFCRYGFANQKVRDIRHFWSVGGQLSQPILGRKDDFLGIGMAQSILGRDYRQAYEYETASSETIYEIYYNFSLHPFMKFIPNIQIVTSPYGKKSSGCNVVGGGRVVVLI